MPISPTVRYQPLSQTILSDDEDEGFGDNILYDSRLIKSPNLDRGNVFEFERLEIEESRTSSFPKIFFSGQSHKTCMLVTVLLVIVLGALTAVLFPILNHVFNHGVVLQVQKTLPRDDWTRWFNGSWTESSVRLVDIDQDGALDILFGIADQGMIQSMSQRPPGKTMREFCSTKGMMTYPCGGSLIALRGYDGLELWRQSTRSVVIYQNCIDIDISGDGTEDCIVTGRQSTCQAVDIASGKLLWVLDPEAPAYSSHFVPEWNIYQAVIIPDVDSDGFKDIIVSHGGDKDKEPWDRSRAPGRLILLSGRTGLPIGDKYLELPQNEETYMPPVKYITDTGAVYILFGSGGETIPGQLMAISLPDLYRAVAGGILPGVNLNQYSWLSSSAKTEQGIALLATGKIKGIMVPPVLVDINKDQIADILVTSFEGTFTLIDGRSLQTKWTRHFEGMESYSVPCPGYFNDDEVIDFMIHVNRGVWDKYNSSKTMVLSGLDGSTLWSVDANSYAYSSDLSLATNMDNKHIFIMKLVGLNATGQEYSVGLNLNRRHLKPITTDSKGVHEGDFTAEEFQNMCASVNADVYSEHPSCDHDLQSFTHEVFIMDQFISDTPVRILQQEAFRHRYEVPHKMGSLHCHPLSNRQRDKIQMCSVLLPTSYTGAIGDIDGDGGPDYIHISQLTGFTRSDTLDITGSVTNVVISKHSLTQALDKGDYEILLGQDPLSDSPSQVQSYFSDLAQMLYSQEKGVRGWTQYLGQRGDGRYYVSPHGQR